MAFLGFAKRTGGSTTFFRLALRARVPFAVLAMVFAAVGLATNYANVDGMLRPLDGKAATHPVTALCLFGLGLMALRVKRFGRAPLWRLALGAMIIGICATRVMESVLSQSTGAAGLAAFGPIGDFSGRFSIEAAIVLGALALAAVLRLSSTRIGTSFLIIGLALTFNAWLEISYGLTFFNGDVGVFTLLGLLFAAGAMATNYVHSPFMRVLFLMGDIGGQARIMAAAVILVPWTCGLLLHQVKDISTAGGAPVEAAMISIITWSMLTILMASASYYERADVARRRAAHEIAMKSRTDQLTKALNRFGMSEVLEETWANFKSSDLKFGLLMLDVDHFQRINDTFGRAAGNDVLERVAANIRSQLRDNDALSRWTGEEFLILLKIKASSDLDIVIGRLRAALEEVNSPLCSGPDGEPMAITMSCGASELLESDTSAADAIKRADVALFEAKDASGDPTEMAFELDILDDEYLIVAEDGDGTGTDDAGKKGKIAA